MSLSRFFYEPFYSLSDFDRLFDEAFTARTNGNGTKSQVQKRNTGDRSLRPRMDIHEDAQTNTATATFELPGLKKEDNGWAVRDSERRYGRFSRSVPLPQGIKSEEIKASLENGVLTVTFLKTSPEQAPKKVTIA